jgi:hypothetical protein
MFTMANFDFSSSFIFTLNDVINGICDTAVNTFNSFHNVITNNKKTILTLALMVSAVSALEDAPDLAIFPEGENTSILCYLQENAGFRIFDTTGQDEFSANINYYNDLFKCYDVGEIVSSAQIVQCLRKGFGLFGITSGGDAHALVEDATDECNTLISELTLR